MRIDIEGDTGTDAVYWDDIQPIPSAGGGSADTYLYAGTGYANPHAPTTVSSITTYTYCLRL